MSRSRILILVVAVVCAVLAALLLSGMLNQRPSSPVAVPAPSRGVPVLIVTKDLAVGERLSASSLAWRDWPRENVAGFMITQDTRPNAISELDGARARSPLYLGEPVADRTLVKASDGNIMSAIVGNGLRGIAIRVSDRTAGSGFILPNDRVDVIATIRVEVKTDPASEDKRTIVFSHTIITNARVLSINQSLSSPAEAPAFTDLQTAVLELSPEQAELVSRAETQGELSLALRSFSESGDGTDEKPQIADISEIPNSVSVYRQGARVILSCEPDCEQALQLVNAPFPLVVRDVGATDNSPNR
jgi:pilus assembly protein CpaB